MDVKAMLEIYARVAPLLSIVALLVIARLSNSEAEDRRPEILSVVATVTFALTAVLAAVIAAGME